MTDKSWIKLYRKSQQNPLYFKEPFTRWHAWQDLLLIANHKPGIVIKHDKVIEIKRGQVGHSILDLSLRWDWSRTKVRGFLKYLENEQQVLVETRQRITSIITIIKYDNYQGKEQEDIEVKEQREDNEKTTRRQREDINKNVKNGKNKTYTSDFLSFWDSYPNKTGKKYCWKIWQKSNDRPPIEQMLKIIEIQKESEKWKKDGGQYIPNPSTWLNQGRWEDAGVSLEQPKDWTKLWKKE